MGNLDETAHWDKKITDTLLKIMATNNMSKLKIQPRHRHSVWNADRTILTLNVLHGDFWGILRTIYYTLF